MSIIVSGGTSISQEMQILLRGKRMEPVHHVFLVFRLHLAYPLGTINENPTPIGKTCHHDEPVIPTRAKLLLVLSRNKCII